MTDAINPKDTAARRANRTMLGMLTPVFKEAVARAMMYGAYIAPRPGGTHGYGAYNWRDQPILLSTYLDATERHIDAIRRGEWNDQHSGCPHAAHIGANANIILDAHHVGTLTDDLRSKDSDKIFLSSESPTKTAFPLVHVSAEQLVTLVQEWRRDHKEPLTAYPCFWSNEIRQNPDQYPHIHWYWPEGPEGTRIIVGTNASDSKPVASVVP